MGGLGSFGDLGVVILECHVGAHITGLKGVPAPAPHFGLNFISLCGHIKGGLQ